MKTGGDAMLGLGLSIPEIALYPSGGDPHPGSMVALRDGTSELLLRNGVDALKLGH